MKAAWILAVCLLFFCAAVKADTPLLPSDAAYPLQGIGKLRVEISVDKDAQDFGVSSDDIQTAVDIKLKEAGIQVLHGYLPDPGGGFTSVFLNVNVVSIKVAGANVLAYHDSVDLMDDATLTRRPATDTLMTSWSTGSIGYIGSESTGAVKDAVVNSVERFVNDYLTANPPAPHPS